MLSVPIFNMQGFMKLLKQLWFFFLLAGASCAALAQTAAGPTPAHLTAAARVVAAMGLPERFIIPTKQLLEGSLAKDPDNAPLMLTTMAPYLQKQYTIDQLKGYFASQFDLDECRRIAAFWEGPVGKKLVRTQVQMLSTGTASELVFTAKEKAIMKRFDATKAGKAFLAAMPAIEDVMAEHTKITQTTMRERFLQDLEKKLDTEPQGKPV